MEKFEDRREALEKLIRIIDRDIITNNTLVLSISNRGTFYAREIALRMGMLEGDFLLIEKIRSPQNPQTVLGAISETKDYVLLEELIDSFEITNDYVFNEAMRVYEEKILQDIYQFRGGESIISLENRDVLLVDEGANTGLNLLCAIKTCVAQKVSRINVAIPIIAKDTASMIEKLVDNTFFVYEIEDFVNIDFYFKETE